MSEVKYEEQKHCCTVCATKRRCHVCDDQTTFACSDCAIDLRATVYVCSKLRCRDEHEKKCAHNLQARLEALDWTPITSENLPTALDEVGGWQHYAYDPSRWDIVLADHAFTADSELTPENASVEDWKEIEMTHRRPLNAPAAKVSNG